MKTFLSILQFFPYALAAIVGVEQAAAATPGESKKQIVLDSVLVAAKVGEAVPVPVVSMISLLIDQIVTSLNASGIFTHKAVAAPAAPAVGVLTPAPVAA
jgi:hypothetical protein